MMTVIRAWTRLTKAHRRTAQGWETSGYGNAHWVAVAQRAVGCVEDVAQVVTGLARQPNACVIRGEPLPGINWERTERRFKKEPVTFREEPRQWLMIDADDVKEPAGTLMMLEPEECAEHARGMLPEVFHDARCYWQASASAAVKPGCRVHLWFWLSRPITSGQAKNWLRRCPVDRTIYTPIQPHYTADPIFTGATQDPMRQRRGWLDGLEDSVEVPAKLEEAPSYDLAMAELRGTPSDPDMVGEIVGRDPIVHRIFTGARPYPDRSTAHFALSCALARAGVTDPDTIRTCLHAYDVIHQRDTSKIQRDDYAARTIGAAISRVGA